MKKKVGVVIPCYKADGHVRKVTEKIFKVFESLKGIYILKIFLINDSCPNNSWKEVKKNKNIILIHHSKNLGVGAASISGFKAALKEKCDVVVKIDADEQHNPSYLKELVPYILNLEVNKMILIKGTRYVYPELSYNTPFIRKLGSLLLEPMIRSSLNYRGLTDVANGFLVVNNFTLNFIMASKIGPRLRKRYLFECSLLEKCSSIGVEIHEFGMVSIYSKIWRSSMQSYKMIFPLLSFCTRSIFRRFFYGYLLKINLGSIFFLISMSNFLLAAVLYFKKISLEVALGITVSAGISTLFTSALTICILSLCLFLLYDYSSGSKVKKIIFISLINEIKNK